MIVHTYYQPVPGIEKPQKLLDLWKENWTQHGWECRILSESDAKDHPGYKLFIDRISRFPTVNNPGYERACYVRHMAMSMVGGGLLVDYDVIVRHPIPQGLDFDPAKSYYDGPLLLEPTRVPCAVQGDTEAFCEICDILYNYEPKLGENHVSDMTILRKTNLQAKSMCVEHLCSGQAIQDHPGDGWKKAPMIHFSTFSFRKLGWTGDKADMIRRVLASL